MRHWDIFDTELKELLYDGASELVNYPTGNCLFARPKTALWFPVRPRRISPVNKQKLVSEQTLAGHMKAVAHEFLQTNHQELIYTGRGLKYEEGDYCDGVTTTFVHQVFGIVVPKNLQKLSTNVITPVLLRVSKGCRLPRCVENIGFEPFAFWVYLHILDDMRFANSSKYHDDAIDNVSLDCLGWWFSDAIEPITTNSPILIAYDMPMEVSPRCAHCKSYQ